MHEPLEAPAPAAPAPIEPAPAEAPSAPDLGFEVRPGPDAPRAEVEGRGLFTLARVSPLDAHLLDESGLLGEAGPVRVRLTALGLGIGPLPGRLEAPSAAGVRRVVLDTPTVDVARALVGLLRALAWRGALGAPAGRSVPSEIIDDPGRIRAILSALAEWRVDGRLSGPDGRVVSARPVAVDAREDRPLTWDVDALPAGAPLQARLGAYNSAFLFRLDDVRASADRLETGLPTRVIRERTRRHRRGPAPLGASVHLRHPIWPELEIRRPLHDVSLSGLALACDAERDLLFPGLELHDLEVRWPRLGRIRLTGRVQHVSDDAQVERELCGLSVTPHPEDAVRWLSAVDRLLHPNTADDAVDARSLWELYRRSGYFNLSGRSDEDFTPLERAFERVFDRLPRARKVACQVMWPSRRGLEAAITMLKPYARSWISYQFARQHGPSPVTVSGRRILRDVLLHGFEYPMRDPDFQWHLTWIQPETRFSRYVIHDLAARWRDRADLVDVRRFRVLQARTAGHGRRTPRDLEVGPAEPEEIRRLLAFLATVRPRPYLEAHDLVPERVDLADISAAWREADLSREREILVARRGGQPVAAAVCETAEEGMHLFGLFDTVRPFALAEGGTAAFGPLVDAASGWYRRHGKQRYAVFLEEAWPEAGPELEDLGEADLAVVSADLHPDQLEHTWEVTASR